MSIKTLQKYLFIIFFISSIFSANGQSIPEARGIIDTLASPEFGGRGYSDGGDKKAATFIANHFKNYSLKSFTDSYFQTVVFNVNVFSDNVKLKINGKKLITGQDYILNPISGSGRGKGKTFWFDSLIFNSEAARRDFMMMDISKKIIIYESKHYADLIKLPVKYLDHLHEAPALIEVQEKKLTASIASNTMNHPTFEMLNNAKLQVAKKVKFRVDAKLIKNYNSQNIVGFVEGKTKSNEYVVISAHYDHLGRMGKKAYFPGANDNASGIAMLLELAKYFSKPENQLDFSICFIAFTGEEVGLLGSKFYVQHPVFPLNQIKTLINLDMVGTGDEGITIVNTTENLEDYDKFVKINSEKNYLPKINKRANAPNSDHYFFTKNGVKAFFIYTLGGIKAYHDIYDKPDTLPLTKFEGVFNLLKDYISSN